MLLISLYGGNCNYFSQERVLVEAVYCSAGSRILRRRGKSRFSRILTKDCLSAESKMGLPAIKSGAGSCSQKIKVNESSGAGMFQGFFRCASVRKMAGSRFEQTGICTGSGI